MSATARLPEVKHPHGHIAQLYGEDDSLLAVNVAAYLAEGLRRGEGAIAVATQEHSSHFVEQLEGLGVSTTKAMQAGRLVFLDAHRTLAAIMPEGVPNWALFEKIIQGCAQDVLSLSGHNGLRAYGEMVGILWKDGHFAAAIQLEEYWNTLLETLPFDLFCAYPINLFDKSLTLDALEPVLCSHTHLLPTGRNFEMALHRAMDEVLGSEAEVLKLLIRANFRPARAVIPRAEAIILWLKSNLQSSADEILERAGQYYPTPTLMRSHETSGAQ